MAAVSDVVKKYQGILLERLMKEGFGFSNNRPAFGKEGVINRLFITKLGGYRDEYIDFLMECGLIKSKMTCEKCGNDMKLLKKDRGSDGKNWVCNKKVNGVMCRTSKSMRAGSWFCTSKLNVFEILLLTYEILRGTKTTCLQDEYGFGKNTLADWRQFVNECILEYVEKSCEKIGGPGKIVEIDESKFGKRKYNKGHCVEGQWVFGGVERDSGKLFLVAVHDRSSDTLMNLIKEWIIPGSVIYSDCWKAYNPISKEGYSHLTVNHSLEFKNEETGCHTNTIECMWRHVKESLPGYNRKGDFQFYLANFIFKRSCLMKNEDCFIKFLEIIREKEWQGAQ